MAAQSEFILEIVIEDKLVELWSEFPCLCDVRLADFKNRDKRENALKEISEKTEHSGRYYYCHNIRSRSNKFNVFF